MLVDDFDINPRCHQRQCIAAYRLLCPLVGDPLSQGTSLCLTGLTSLNRGRLDRRCGRPLGGERAVDLINRAAARLEADEQHRYKRESRQAASTVCR